MQLLNISLYYNYLYNYINSPKRLQDPEGRDFANSFGIWEWLVQSLANGRHSVNVKDASLFLIKLNSLIF